MLGTSGNRAVDMLITYRLLRILTTPFNKQDAFKYGIVDKDGKVLRKYSSLSKPEEKKSYTWLHRFCFNLKRIMSRVGFGSRLGSIALALGVLLKEHSTSIENESGVYSDDRFLKSLDRRGIKQYPNMEKYLPVLESGIVQYLKFTGKYEELLKEDQALPPVVELKQEELLKNDYTSVYKTILGHDIILNEKTDRLISFRDQTVFRNLVWTGDDNYEVI
tara:strand:+ start:55 stop:711 length:657 start_codon:yes stop_codon:yes gene_type:complete